ncbi:MAG: DUF2752 domain-containing protein, partial [Acidobacteriota bacterium]
FRRRAHRDRRFAVTTRSLSTAERRLAFLWFAAAVSVVALRPAWMAVAPFLEKIVFRSITDVSRPICRTTRAAMALLKRDLATSFAANPRGAAAGLVVVAGVLRAFLWATSRWPIPAAEVSGAGRLGASIATFVPSN